MARIHGSRGQVSMDPAGGSSLTEVGSLNTWSLDLSRDRADTTSFGDTNKQSVPGLPNFTGGLGGFWDVDDVEDLFDVALGTAAATLQLIPNRDAAARNFEGPAYIDMGINVAATGAIGINGRFEAAGNWDFN